MNFKLIIFLFLSICTINFLNSQITKVDSQWYVLNKNGRSLGSVNATGQYPYGNYLNANNINIIGTTSPIVLNPCTNTSPPAYPNPCALGIARNDLFIIYENGSYFNSRDLSSPIPWQIQEIKFNTLNKVKYLYFTNIYEEDDPPQNIEVNNSGSNANDLPNFIPPSHTMTSNHDIVRGKDYTIIIPFNLIKDSCGSILLPYPKYSLKINPVNYDLNGNSYNKEILKLNNSFKNNFGIPTWVYPDITVTPTISSVNGFVKYINDISYNTGQNFQFINFNADFENDPNLIGKTVKIEAFCSTDLTKSIASLDTEISDIHDPNYIEVKCIYKKKKPWYCPWCHDRYFVKYYVEFMNDGNMPVNSVIVNFILPDIAIPSTFIVGKWKYGTNTGCGNNPAGILNYSIPATSNVSVSLSEYPARSVLGSQDPADLSVHLPNQYGGFEFCIEVNQDPTLYNSWSLQPQSPTTNFDGVVYPIQNFLDPYITVKSVVESNVVKTRKRSIGNIWKNCNCACLQTQSNSQSGNHD